MTRTTRRLLTFAFAATAVVVFSACSGQGEGQRCDTADDEGNYNDPGGSDCATGLECFGVGALGGVAATYASPTEDPTLGICCPPNRAQATTTICSLQPSPPGGDAGFVDGGGTGDGATGDSSSLEGSATPEGSTESEGSTDAPADSPADSPSDSPTG